MESLKEKTAKGMFWGGIGNGGQQVLGLVFGIVLGRILSPDDYGMIAMITIFSLIANELQNSGFKAALANLKQPTDNDYNSVFWFNILMSATLYTILFFCAPLIAAFYHKPELVPLCRYAFVGFVLSSLGTAQAAWLFKNLRTRQQAKTGLIAVTTSCIVGTVMALSGFSYWSLATQNIVFIGINTLLLWHYSPWRPSLRVDFGPVRRMFRFSCKILASGILTHVNTNVLNILLGRYFSVSDTGFYNQAYQWNFKCYNLIQGMNQMVAQPVFVALRDERERQVNALRKMIRFTAFISFPALLGFGMVAHEFIVITITEKWQASADLIKMLCISGALMPLNTLLSNMIISKGKSDIYLWCTVTLGLLQIVLMMLLHPYGIHTMVAAYVALNVAWFLVWLHFTNRLTGYRVTMALADVLPYALSAVAVMAVTHTVTAGIADLRLLLAARIVVAAALYYGVMRVVSNDILNECMQFIKSKRGK